MIKSKFKDLINSETPVLIDFHADWCGPCKMMSPILVDLKKKLGEEVKIIKIDIDKNRSLTSKYQVQGVPTLMLFKEGELKWRKSGVHTASQLENMIVEYA